ncbi:DegQ family serine endoprotease [Alkalilimnicola ehrlichii MLHE-1]|uniref:Probable periplasmic serine endoprotease DegP-like n=1 Tax=Alkalilimnicola ehrlichii (strain ATCC BAA-1101 / DSM 17681 / MLHE-1) TaxID=187272 RepID=Q0A8Z5_ALKEH|nr:DegQ family serine endoprotease [Alkalilimnicola ehrlichii]ABI56692.1 protease Do [Alkalilimnicola ehrlichii MLHE-1]
MNRPSSYGYLAALLALALLTFGASAGAKSHLPDFTELVEENSPAVVNISTRQTPESRGGSGRLPDHFDIPEDHPLRDFMERFFGERGERPPEHGQRRPRSLGSGFIISEDGYVLTNHHVIDGADEVNVRLSDRREFVAEVIGSDERSDVAVLKIDAEGLPTVRIGQSDTLRVGEWVLAIGSPFGFEHSATAGIVSAKGRSLPSGNYVPYLQTDVAINPGNSGGPLFNLDGEVVGINSQIYSRTGGFMGVSFSIPIELAMDVATQLRETGRVARGWLGVIIQDVTRDLAESFDMDRPRGALVAQVLSDSPALEADLQPGDIIVEFDGEAVETSGSLPPMVGATPVGAEVQVKVLREGREVMVDVTIGELPEEQARAQRPPRGEPERAPDTAAERLGLRVEPVPAERLEELRVDSGVLVRRVESGPAREAGIRPGDVITSIDQQSVEGVEQFAELVEGLASGRSVPVLVLREGGARFFALRIP